MMHLLRGSFASHRRRRCTARHAQTFSPGDLLAVGIAGERGVSRDRGPRAPHTAEPIGSGCTGRGPLPLSALSAQHACPVVVGLLRPDLCICWNRAASSAVIQAEDHAIRTNAARHRWRLVHMQCVQQGSAGITDPVEHLLLQVIDRRADAVVVADRLYLTDLRGRDRLAAVRQVCAVITLSPEQVWPRTVDAAASSERPTP